MGPGWKNACWNALRWSGALPLAMISSTRRATVLGYHRVVEHAEKDSLNARLEIPLATLRRHLEFLRRRAHVMPLHAMLEGLRKSRELPPRAVALTFDDGYRSDHALAAPLLREFSMPAAFFPVVGFVENQTLPWWYRVARLLAGMPAASRRSAYGTLAEKFLSASTSGRGELMKEAEAAFGAAAPLREPGLFMDWDQLRELSRDPLFEIGAHSLGHPNLAAEPEEDMRREITQSRAVLEEKLGRPVRLFAYPYGGGGALNPAVLRAAAGAGYAYAMTSLPGRLGPPAAMNPHGVARIGIDGRDGAAALEAKLSGVYGGLRRLLGRRDGLPG